MLGLFIFFYFSARKLNCFFGTFYFSAEKGKSCYGRPLLWTNKKLIIDAVLIHVMHVNIESQIPQSTNQSKLASIVDTKQANIT